MKAPRSPLFTIAALSGLLIVAGCADDFVVDGGDSMTELAPGTTVRESAPVSEDFSKLRHPQLLGKATSAASGKTESGKIHLYLAFNEYEADGVTRRVLDKYGVTRRILDKYGDAIRLKVRVDKARPGFTVKIDATLFDEFMTDMQGDLDIYFVEPDAELGGSPLVLRDGLAQNNQAVPWNLDRIGGIFTSFNDDDVRVYVLDSGIFDHDLDIVEQKDFTMLFLNRNEEYWDDSAVIDMPVFDPGVAGDPVDGSGHGTHVSGTIGAKDNSQGILGVAPNAKIHSLKVLTADGRTDITTAVAAIDYVTDQKQQYPLTPMIVNMSLGADIGTSAYNALDEAIQNAVDYGVVVVVSAGNDGNDAATYSPAHVAEAITVGAYDRDNRFLSFSNHGPVVDILAPGMDVVSLTHLQEEADNNENILLSGTSMAAPHVAGAAALYLSLNPEASPATVKQALISYGVAGISDVPEGTTDRSVFVGEFADDGNTKSFAFTKSNWNREVKKLTLEGDGPRLGTVTILSGATGQTVVELTIDSGGSWKYEVVEPPFHACEYTATYLDQEATLPVFDASGDCDRPLSITKAEWDDGKSKLTVEGYAPRGSDVTLTDKQTDAFITTVAVDNKGKFRFQQEPFAFEPCAVQATVSPLDQTTHLVTDNASAECEASTQDLLPVNIWKAEWDKLNKKLSIEGVAHPLSSVALKSQASGFVLGTDVANENDGKWKVAITDPLVVPCVVELHTDGTYAEHRAVASGATLPSDCERPLELELVKWHGGDEELELKGRGVYNGSVDFFNSRTGLQFGSASIDDKGKFSVKLTADPVPCSITAQSEGTPPVTLEADVELAAWNCDFGITLHTAQWIAGSSTMSIGGLATGGATIVLTNPDNGSIIDTTIVDSNRNWRFDVDLSATGLPPCRVRARAEFGEYVDRTLSTSECNPDFVFVAPENEPTEQNPYTFIGITKAEWQSGNKRLVLEGEGYVNAAVAIVNPATGQPLGNTTTNTSWKWALNVVDPGTVPCTVRATLDGRDHDRAVKNTPLNCDDKAWLELSKAEWKDGDKKLTIEGKGLTRSGAQHGTVALTNGITGQNISAASMSSGEWVIQILNPTVIPCSITAQLQGTTETLEVNDAPADCNQGLPSSYIVTGDARWETAGGVLRVRGKADPFSTVTVMTGSGSIALGATVTHASGRWSFEAVSPAQVPCSVIAASGNESAAADVVDAPKSCQ